MIDSDSESLYQAKFLVGRYQERESRPWSELKESAEQTTAVIRDVVESLVDHYNQIGDQELTILYRLCQNSSDGLSAEEKREQVRKLDFPPNEIERITTNIDHSVGSVGAAMQEPKLHVGGKGEYSDAQEDLYECFQQIVENYDSESELVEIAADLVNIDFHRVQSGRMSPILHYLAPTVFPVINGRSKESIGLLFGGNVSTDLDKYLDERGHYVELREQFDLKSHFRDLDYFLIWLQLSDNEWTERLREGITRKVWQVQPGYAKYSVPEELWPIWRDRGIISAGWIGKVDESSDELSGWTANFVKEMSKGDVVIAKGGVHQLLGLGVITKEDYEYVGGTDEEIPVHRPDKEKFHESIRHVDWVFTRDYNSSIYIGDWDITKRFGSQWIAGYYNFQELRWNLAEKHRDEVLFDLKSLESKSIAYTQGKEPEIESSQPGGKSGITEEIPDAPARAGEIERQLEAKNQVVFYGPPGTGKTYTAKQFARWWLGQQDVGESISDRIDTVTFHPSFTYEDFVEGLSAETDNDGQVAYEIEDGNLKEILKPAMNAYKDAIEAGTEIPRYVLIIDEINRGNLAQIFGELITLLEADKRETFEVDLAHSGASVTLPPNLYIIGTMNTADQSIALVDTALRRRFRFIDFPPDLDIVWDLAEVEKSTPGAAVGSDTSTSPYEKLLGASVLAIRELNDRILNAPDLGKGKQLGHSHLLDVATPAEIVDVWRYDILPQLEEYYFGQFDRLRDELLTETGELLVSWDEEQIKSFTAQDLYQALCHVAGVDDFALFDELTEPTQAVGDTDIEEINDSWAQNEKTVDAFRERVEHTVEPEINNRVERLIDLGEEIGWVDTGRGDNSATVQLKSESVDPGVGVLQVRQNGQIEFKWNWLIHRDENELTGEFIDDAASELNQIDEYDHDWQPDEGEDGIFVEPDIMLENLTVNEMDTLVDGVKTFVQKADEMQNE